MDQRGGRFVMDIASSVVARQQDAPLYPTAGRPASRLWGSATNNTITVPASSTVCHGRAQEKKKQPYLVKSPRERNMSKDLIFCRLISFSHLLGETGFKC